jgi:hypothetical protein
MCEQSFPGGVSFYQALSSCAQQCVPCNESGAGDPCGGLAYPCTPNVACNGVWCTRPCNGDADCTGIGPSGGNYLGFPNSCIRTSAGNACAPGCSVAEDCTAFGPDMTCVVSMDVSGSEVTVCGAPGDAAAE